MKLQKKLTTVTRLSKTIAFLLFIFLPIIAFLLGIQYQQNINTISNKAPLPHPIRKNTEEYKNQTTIFFGKLAWLERPAPDIDYDYQLLLEQPYTDTNNASGLPQQVHSVVLISSDPEIQMEFEKNIDKEVAIEGSWEWGYAESKVFRVVSILQSASSKKQRVTPSIPFSWKHFINNNKEFSFSLHAPETMHVHFCPIASFGGYCEGEDGNVGVYMKESDFPFGLVIEQTILLGLTDEMARTAFPENFKNAVSSDIDFGVPGAVKTQGKDREDIHGIGLFKDYEYTKYTFRKGNNLYMASIRTDEQLTNFNLFKQILETWKFE